MRLFVAVVPPDDVLDDLDRFCEPRRAAGRADGLRWTPPEQWHVTLAFAERAAPDRLDEIEERLGAAAGRRTAFSARLAGGGALPDAARAKVVHAGLSLDDGAATELDRLAVGARTALATAGVPVDGRGFRPHLTLARLGRPTDVTPWVRLLDAYAGPSFLVDRVTLVASHLGEGPRGRPRHEPLAEFALV